MLNLVVQLIMFYWPNRDVMDFVNSTPKTFELVLSVVVARIKRFIMVPVASTVIE